MIVNIILLLVLALAFYQGYRQGLAMQLIRLATYVVTFILATNYIDTISSWIEMIIPFPAIQPDTEFIFYSEELSFFVDDAFYRVIAYILVFIFGMMLSKLLSVFLSKIQHYQFLETANGVLGGFINIVLCYLMIFMVLFLLSLLPIEWVQQQFVNYPTLYWIVSSTPIISQWAMDAWLVANPFI